ncbi:MAG: hypothetical protein ACREVZ_11405 [Burkholderiales bacterium]
MDDIGFAIVVVPPLLSAARATLKLHETATLTASSLSWVRNFIKPPGVIINVGAFAAAS